MIERRLALSLKKVARLLILSVLATAVATWSSAEDGGLRSGSPYGRNVYKPDGRNVHKPDSVGNGLVVGGIILDGYGYGGEATNMNGPSNGTGNADGYGDWYGISSTHRECPFFRQRVLTPDGWQVRMVPVC